MSIWPKGARTLPIRRILALIFLGAVLFVVAARTLSAPPLSSSATSSQMVVAADGSLLRLTLAGDDQYRLWTDLDAFPQHTSEAILLKEDRYFRYHPGVNPSALIRAAWKTCFTSKRQGGSTLTMQLARRLYHLNTRKPLGKLRQIVLACWLEARYSKDALLEAYFNLAPMGANIEGIPAAARIYFNKEISQLSLAESLALAVLPQNPGKRGKFGDDQQKARQQLAGQWRQAHPEDEESSLADQVMGIGANRQQLPFAAPHLVNQLLKEKKERRIQTTLNPQMQSLLERLVHQYIQERSGVGITNAAVLLVDHRSMEVRAMMGSADFFNQKIQGQVNGVRARRSPGSTLKPFLYGLALDQGRIHPLSVLHDTPSAFGPYQPENFDGRFLGPVSAQDALIRSRNVPAVELANQLHYPRLYDLLKQAGISYLQPEEHYGLSLILGGGELTMEDLAGLYGMLANNGQYSPLRYCLQDAEPATTRLLSPQAAFLVKEMLKANPRPGSATAARRGDLDIAWKTGTSWGFRDAWTAGIIGDYVVIVWIGNFDGRPNPAFVSLKAAAPLFFRIADALPLILPKKEVEPAKIPDGLSRIEVCTASGDLPNRWCPQKSITWFIPGVSPIRVSNLHRPVYINIQTGKAACPPFDPEKTRMEIFEFWPSDITALFKEAGLPRRLPPEPDTGCKQAVVAENQEDAPRIRSPLSQVTYTLRETNPQESIDLQATVAGDSESVFWFAGTLYLGRSDRGQPLPWRPTSSGTIEITAVDDSGRSSSREIEVVFIP